MRPTADLHIHQESAPRLDRVYSAAVGRAPVDWAAWCERTLARVPPGIGRLKMLTSAAAVPDDLDSDQRWLLARILDLFQEAAGDGAVLVEMRCGRRAVRTPEFFAVFREAERLTRLSYPHFHAEPLVMLKLWYGEDEVDRIVDQCVAAARVGLAGIDMVYLPYHTEADWTLAYRMVGRLHEAGLGVTAHAGEFSAANIAAALRLPGVTRLGHALHAAYDPRLVDLIGSAGVTVECCLTSNVRLGAVDGYDAHPITGFVSAGISVALGTDDPVQLNTTIGREYDRAAAMGFAAAELDRFTDNAVAASFTSAARKRDLRAALGHLRAHR